MKDLWPYHPSADGTLSKTAYLPGACWWRVGELPHCGIAPHPLLSLLLGAGVGTRSVPALLHALIPPGPVRRHALPAGGEYTFGLESRNPHCREGEVVRQDSQTYTVPASTQPAITAAAGTAAGAALSVVAPEGVDPAELSGQYKLYVLDPSTGSAVLKDLGVVAPTNAGAAGAGTWAVPLTFEVPLSAYPGAGQPGYYQASKAARGCWERAWALAAGGMGENVHPCA